MKLVVVVAPLVTLAVLGLSLSPVGAAPGPGCLPTPLPSGPGSNPSFIMEVQDVGDRVSVRLWRQPCQDSEDVVLLLRVTPTSPSAFVCRTRWYLDQETTRFYVTFLSALTGPELCDRISGPVTVIVSPDRAEGESGTFEDDDDFALVYLGSLAGSYVVFRLDVPYAGPASPVITVVSTKCNPCRSGQIVGFNGTVDNPGPTMQAEVKAGARFPDGSIVALVNRVVTIPSGPSVLTLIPTQTLAAGLPTIDVRIEAAILEPTLGVTLSRHNVILHLMP